MALAKEWIIGFIEAEGSFTYTKSETRKYPRFLVTQKNKKILRKIKKQLPIKSKIDYNKTNDSYQLRIDSLERCKRLIRYLEGHIKNETTKRKIKRWKAYF